MSFWHLKKKYLINKKLNNDSSADMNLLKKGLVNVLNFYINPTKYSCS